MSNLDALTPPEKPDYHKAVGRVREWARLRKVEKFSSPIKQFQVTLEEIEEVKEALELYRLGRIELHDLLLELGDVLFTVELIISMLNPDIDGLDCLIAVCNKNEKRTGAFNNEGKWVKDDNS